MRSAWGARRKRCTSRCLQSNPPAPGEESVILRVFAAWPKEWNARFTLLARGGFLVTAAIEKGEIDSVELVSQAGAPCRLRNPWAGATVEILRAGGRDREPDRAFACVSDRQRGKNRSQASLAARTASDKLLVSGEGLAVSIKDVAARAAVSTATVSHVLNGTRHTRPRTRDRVLAAVRELGYSQNQSARNLARGTSTLLGLIVSDVRNPFFPEITAAFQDQALAHEMDALVLNTNYDAQRTLHSVRRLLGLASAGRCNPDFADRAIGSGHAG